MKFMEKLADMKKEEIIKRIRENKDKIKGFGVKRIGIFGSIVRGEDKEDSDIDIIVEFEEEAIYEKT